MACFWNQIRQDFPLTRKYVYLDHAAAGPIIPLVKEAVDHYHKEQACEGDAAWPKWMKRRDEARRLAAQFIGADPDEVAFIQSTSHGMNLVAELLASQGAVLTNECEFPSSTLPWVWRRAAMVWQKPEHAGLSTNTLKRLLSPKIRTILTSYVQYATGFRQDLEAVGKMKGRRFLVVNATQGFGAFPIDVQKWNADFLTTNSYKWLMAGYGCGLLYVRKGWLSKFRPASLGWRSVEQPDLMNNRSCRIKPKASRYELGCPNFPGIFALGAAIHYLHQIGIEKISERILELHRDLRMQIERLGLEILSPADPRHHSGILTFRMPNPVMIWKRLQSENICVSARGGGIRVAPHFYNNHEDLERLIKRIKLWIKTSRG